MCTLIWRIYLSFQNVEEEIVFDNDSGAIPDIGSNDALELIIIPQMEPCLPFAAKSLLANHGNSFSRP